MSYATLTDLKNYLSIAVTSADDALLQRMLDAASARIDSRTQRSYYAGADSTRYHDYGNFHGGELQLDGDLSHLTTVTNGNSVDITASVYLTPRRGPAYAIGIKSSSGYSWDYTDDTQNAIPVTGRWAYMDKVAFTAISRSTNVVTATLSNAAPLSVGQSIEVIGVADTSFNGSFVVTAQTSGSVSWAQSGTNDTDTTGYILSCPQDILQACRRLAAWLYRQKDNQNGDADRPVLLGDGTVIMPTTLPGDVEKLLQPYCRMVY